MQTLQNHEFLFLFSMVRPNESPLLDSCGPRRCVGVSIPAYPSGKYSAESETAVTPSLPTLKHSNLRQVQCGWHGDAYICDRYPEVQ